jgi:DNA repair exonuclease SbcCD ATPase subunit
MMKTYRFVRGALAGCCLSLLSISVGCDDQASQTLKRAEESAESAAATIAEDAGELVKEGEAAASDAIEQGKQMASELGEKATAYLTPLKEKFGNLESLKGKPEELKTAVNELLQSLEQKTEDIQLPEAISTALATIKEKLIALKEYLAGEVEQSQLDQRLQEISESVKSGLGM